MNAAARRAIRAGIGAVLLAAAPAHAASLGRLFFTPDGRSLRQALDFLVPFATGQRRWTYAQIAELRPEAMHGLLRRAAAAWSEPKYRTIAESVGGSNARLDLTVR